MHFKMGNGLNVFIIKLFCPIKCSLEYPFPLIIWEFFETYSTFACAGAQACADLPDARVDDGG